MNIFRLIADLMHLASILILILKITQARSASGFKTQVLYLVVFCSRYLDLFTHFISIYNTAMKIFFIASSAWIVYVMWFKYRSTWDVDKRDSFKWEYLLASSLLLSLLFNYAFTPPEILWSFSVYLEALAILPQLHILTKTGECETITTHYLFALGSYRALYIVNWVYRYYHEGYTDPIAWVAGAVQTVLYSDFLYVYVTKVMQGQKFALPV